MAYRTHPHVYGGTFVASGDGENDSTAYTKPYGASHTTDFGIVTTEHGGGMTLVNSIVLSRSFARTRGVTVRDCPNAMDVGNLVTIGSPNATVVVTSTDRVFISDRNVITGFGAHPGTTYQAVEKFPRVALTDYTTGGYTASSSTDGYNPTFVTWKVFDHTHPEHSGWSSSRTETFSAHSEGSTYSGSNSLGDVSGEWIKLKLPEPVKLSHFILKHRAGGGEGIFNGRQAPKDFTILGSNDDITWDTIKEFTGEDSSSSGIPHTLDASSAYRYVAIVVTRIHATELGQCTIGELEYFGSPEVEVERKQAFGAFPMSMREVMDADGKSLFVGANTTRRVYDEQWLANLGDTELVDASKFENIPPRLWRPFGLSAGCEWTLSNADDRKPQLHSMFFPTDATRTSTDGGFLDPRPTEGMRYAHAVDDPPVSAHRGFALTALPSAKAAIDALLSEPADFPGAFTASTSSLWFSVRTEPSSVRGMTLGTASVKILERRYAHVQLTRENACVPMVNVLMEQNTCYRTPSWFKDRFSPLTSGVARLGNFDSSTVWKQYGKIPRDTTDASDVLADVPYTLTHDLVGVSDGLSDTSNSYAGGSVVAQLVADSVLVAYKRGSRSANVHADIAVVLTAHVLHEIPAGVFTRGDASGIPKNPNETFVAVEMSGSEIKSFLQSGMHANDTGGFPFAAGVRWEYDDEGNEAANNFQVLATGSDRVWVPLQDADVYTVVVPATVANDEVADIDSFSSFSSQTLLQDGDFKTLLAEHASALGVLTETSPAARSMRTVLASSGVHVHNFDKAMEPHVKINVTDGTDPTMIEYASYDDCVSSSRNGDTIATGVAGEPTAAQCVNASFDTVRVVAIEIPPGSIDSNNKIVTAEWTNVQQETSSCPSGAMTNDHAAAMFTFYEAASETPEYSFGGSAPQSGSTIGAGTARKLLFASDVNAFESFNSAYNEYSGPYLGADVLCPAWEKSMICGWNASDACGADGTTECVLETDVGGEHNFVSTGNLTCIPANDAGSAYFNMLDKIENLEDTYKPECQVYNGQYNAELGQINITGCQADGNCVYLDGVCVVSPVAALEADNATDIVKTLNDIQVVARKCGHLGESVCNNEALCTWFDDNSDRKCKLDKFALANRMASACSGQSGIGDFTTFMTFTGTPSPPYVGIPAHIDPDVAGSPCYHVFGLASQNAAARNGTRRFFCDASGGLTQVTWFSDSNPTCAMSIPPDELAYGAHRINWRSDLASCDDASEYELKHGNKFPKIEGSCGGFDLAGFYARTDGRVGPFASRYKYTIPVPQREESKPWGCATAGCDRARDLGYAI